MAIYRGFAAHIPDLKLHLCTYYQQKNDAQNLYFIIYLFILYLMLTILQLKISVPKNTLKKNSYILDIC